MCSLFEGQPRLIPMGVRIIRRLAVPAISAGADPEHVNGRGDLPVETAEERGHQEIVELLEAAEKSESPKTPGGAHPRILRPLDLLRSEGLHRIDPRCAPCRKPGGEQGDHKECERHTAED